MLVAKETDQAGYILKFERDEVDLGLPARSQDVDNDLAARFEHAFADFVVGRLAHVNASHALRKLVPIADVAHAVVELLAADELESTFGHLVRLVEVPSF